MKMYQVYELTAPDNTMHLMTYKNSENQFGNLVTENIDGWDAGNSFTKNTKKSINEHKHMDQCKSNARQYS